MFLTYGPVGPSSFSMRDEARNTESHGKHWGFSGTSLRHAGINFVCAGPMDPQVLLEPREPQPEANSGEGSTHAEGEGMEATFDQPQPEGNVPLNPEGEIARGEPMAMKAEQAPAPVTQGINVNVTMLEEMDINRREVNTSAQTTVSGPSEDIPFVVDVCLTKGNKPRLEFNPQLDTPAPTRSPISVSSGEEIVFVPRKQRKRKAFEANSATPSKPVSRPRSPSQSSVRAATPPRLGTFLSTALPVNVIDDPIHVTIHTAIYTGPSQNTPTSKSRKKKERKKARKEKRVQRYTRGTSDDFDDAVFADYIENTNMEELEEFVNGAGRRDVGGDNTDEWLSVSDDDDDHDDHDDDDDSNDDDGDNEDDEDQWDENNLEEFDAISTADEGKGRVHKVLRKRQRPSGLQYLIKWEGTKTDDATWILAEAIDSAAERLVKKFEKREHIRELLAQTSEYSDEGEDEESDDEDEDYKDEGEADDQYLRKKRAQERADFNYASRLAREEGGDVPNGFGSFVNNEEDDDEHKASGKMGFAIKPKKGKYPSASKVANALSGEWDPMDWASPNNVAPKKKRNKDKAKRTQWDLSDAELKTQLRCHWDNDRKAKKGKKAEREALRKEGLLGMGCMPGKKDMKARYIDGMNMAQVHKEVHDFLMSDYPSIALPPMGKAARKAIHNVAFALDLESRSQGHGKHRFPVLFKTRKTDVYIGDSGLIMRQLGMSEKKTFLPRGDQTPKKFRKLGGGGGGAGVAHRDGDMVGGHAPEIGLDNKGRRMLEKMGYKTGTGLGAEGNKGIMAPIIAVVKTSRAGLG
ncbi:hypothetical protein BGX38DRAFT_16335 [Terfezia claveryi]|nr:hypothetical protein BGX38DRAFT_16335 [Terfezia claveryi]